MGEPAKKAKPEQVQDAPGAQRSPEAESIRDQYKKKRWELRKLREDRDWWRGVHHDPRMIRVMDKFRADLKRRVYALRDAAKSELETKQQDIKDREAFLRIIEQERLANEVEQAEADLAEFTDSNGLFLQGLADLADEEIFESLKEAS